MLTGSATHMHMRLLCSLAGHDVLAQLAACREVSKHWRCAAARTGWD